MSALLRKQKYDLVYIRASHFAYLALYFAKNSNLKSILEVNKPLSMQSFNRKGGFSNLKRDSVKKISSEIKQYEYSDLISIDSKLRSKWILKFVDKVIDFKDDDIGSCIHALEKVKELHKEDEIYFANGGDRDKENIPEMSVDGINFLFGVGGDDKKNSSSWILKKWQYYFEKRQDYIFH